MTGGQGGKRHDLDAINAALALRIDSLVERLYSNAKADRQYWHLGNAQGDPGSSLKIWRRGHRQGEWFDFGAGKGKGNGGGPLALVIEAPFGGNGDAGAGIRWAVSWLGLGGMESAESAAERERRDADARARRKRREAEHAADVERLSKAALRRFLEGVAVIGTASERYLLGRGIDLKILGRQPGALRHHPAMKDKDGTLRPCLLAAVTGPDGGFATVHRHFLAEISGGRVWKAPVEDPKRAYGPYFGGHIPVWRGESGLPAAKMPEGEWIVGAEGLEDCLSIAIADPSLRVWASVSLNNMGAMVLPPQAGGLLWHRHRGDGPEAEAAFFRAREAQEARGVTVKECWAPGGAKDFNEWLMKEAGLLPAGAE